MATYATREHVRARAGKLASAWTDDSIPGNTETDMFVAEASDEIDAAIVGLGLSLPPSTGVQEAVLGAVADKALILMIDGSWPGGSGGAEVEQIKASAEKRLEAFWDDWHNGRIGALQQALAEAGAGAEGATSFWTEEPDYPYTEDNRNPALAPWVSRTSRL